MAQQSMSKVSRSSNSDDISQNSSTADCLNEDIKKTAVKFATIGTRRPARLERLTTRKKRKWISSGDNHGFVRLYAPTGSRSIVYPVTMDSTVQDICAILGFEAIYLQIGRMHIRSLAGSVKPLQVQNEILSTIGYEKVAEMLDAGDATHLTHIFCFFMGRPEQGSSAASSKEILVARCLVRKRRILHKWVRRRCILYNGTIRIEHEEDDDEVLMLSRYKVDVAEGSRGKYLRLTDASHIYCFYFDAIGEMNLWLSRVVQTQIAPTCNLSDQHLLFLPDRLFSVGVDRHIISLNLRRNSLLMKSNVEVRGPPIGWLDDVSRLSALRTLNIADNVLHGFPSAVVQLSALTELTLSGNRIREIPTQIRMLSNLTQFNISNNWLSSLPSELAECQMISNLDLSFNHFEQVPDVIFALKKLAHMQLAGNEISSSSIHSFSSTHFSKVDLRRNVLQRSVRLTSFVFDALTEIDVRDNSGLEELDLSNVPTLQLIHCERLRLKTLQINGSSLRNIYADNNELKQVIIMPIPIHLMVFSIANNKLISLPEWITDLPLIETISAHHNAIIQLPFRIFMNVSSLKNLMMNNNEIERLPEVVENCSLEVLSLHNNRIELLPADLLKSAHKLRNLNVSYNRLYSLPPPNTMIDLNRIQYLRAAGNNLNESVVGTVVCCRRLRLLDLSYNQLRFFDDSCLSRLTALEEVNLSSNLLTSVSPAFGLLPNLQILRLHSNAISSLCDLSHSPSLFLLDIANNELENLNTDLCMARTLKHLDLTCNISLRVDTNTIKPKKKGRAVAVVDIGSESNSTYFHYGFSETAGHKNKLCIRQIRQCENGRGIFGIVDGGCNDQIPLIIVEKLRQIVPQQLKTDATTLKMSLVKAHEHLGQLGERLGASAFLMQVSKQNICCASSGHIRAVLCRNGGPCDITGDICSLTQEEYKRIRRGNATITQDNLIEGVSFSARSLGFSFLYPAVVPNPVKITVPLLESDEFLVVGSRALWTYLSIQQVIDLIKPIQNPQSAAKKLQDTVQSLEYTGNLSVIVIRFKKAGNAPENIPQLRRSQFTLKCQEELLFSEGDVSDRGETTLRNIEERLEQISEAISKIEDDSNNNSRTDIAERLFKNSVRRTKQHRSVESRSRSSIPQTLSLSCSGSATDVMSPIRAPSSASAPPDPQSSEQAAEQMQQYSIRGRINMFGQINDVRLLSSRERFQQAKLTVGEQLILETPQERHSRNRFSLT